MKHSGFLSLRLHFPTWLSGQPSSQEAEDESVRQMEHIKTSLDFLRLQTQHITSGYVHSLTDTFLVITI